MIRTAGVSSLSPTTGAKTWSSSSWTPCVGSLSLASILSRLSSTLCCFSTSARRTPWPKRFTPPSSARACMETSPRRWTTCVTKWSARGPRGDPRRRPPEVLPSSGQGFPSRLRVGDEVSPALHVLPLLHRLLGHQRTAAQAGVVPPEPLCGLGGPQVRLSDDAARGSEREHGVSDGTRAAPGPWVDRHAGGASVGRAERHTQRGQRHLLLPACPLCSRR